MPRVEAMTDDAERPADLPTAVRAYGAQVRAQLGLDEAGPVSYAGLWLLLARLSSVVEDESEFSRTFGLDRRAAQAAATQLFDEPHPTVAAALGAWLADGVELSGELPVTLDPLPAQAELDAWAGDHTRGLIDKFPIQRDPLTLLVLASALVLTPRWSHGVGADESDGLVVSDGLQAVVETSIGPVAVVIPPTNDAVDVVSVIAAPDVAPRDVWRAVDEVAAALNAGTLVDNAFPSGMTEDDTTQGHAWSIREETREFAGPAPDEGAFVWESRMPQWSAPTRHTLTDAAGVALVTDPIRELLPDPEDSKVACVQSATARYDVEGFSAAAVTAIGIRASSMPMRQSRRVRVVTLDFHRPHAVVAIARGGAWEGILLFQAWVASE